MAGPPAKVPGAPGTVYEATWGRMTMKSKTFIGRVYAMDETGDGGLQVFACDHKHPGQASARDCALGEALVLAKRSWTPTAGPVTSRRYGMPWPGPSPACPSRSPTPNKAPSETAV